MGQRSPSSNLVVIEDNIDIEVELEDERLSSVEANNDNCEYRQVARQGDFDSF